MVDTFRMVHSGRKYNYLDPSDEKDFPGNTRKVRAIRLGKKFAKSVFTTVKEIGRATIKREITRARQSQRRKKDPFGWYVDPKKILR